MISEELKKENEERFYNIMKSVSRKGKDEFLSYLKNKTDFFSAPAAENGVLACPGGLLQHCLNVYDCAMKKVQSAFWNNEAKAKTENMIIASLFANLHLINYFEEMRNDKKELTGYHIVDKMPFGQGEKSVWIMNSFMQLFNCEVYSIRWFKANPTEAGFITAAKSYPLTLVLYEAEIEARMIVEKR